MCKYCKVDERQEIRKNLFRKTLPFGQMKFIIDLDIIGDDENVSLLVDVYPKDSDSQIFDKVIKIQYCPMCGRKLTNEIEP